MIQAKAQGVFSIRYILDHLGQQSVLALSGWRERAAYDLDSEAYTFVRKGRWNGIDFTYLLQSPRGTLALARRRRSLWREGLELEHAGRVYGFQQLHFWSHSCAVHDGERQVGTIRRHSVWARRMTVELPDEWPLPIQAFTLWLVLVTWNRYSAAGDATAATNAL